MLPFEKGEVGRSSDRLFFVSWRLYDLEDQEPAAAEPLQQSPMMRTAQGSLFFFCCCNFDNM
tara:strand:+ start:3509 stop:3694 length:186 start_codon:yes stop_codon:yes gene_type:complete